jgi:hypothetical protein
MRSKFNSTFDAFVKEALDPSHFDAALAKEFKAILKSGAPDSIKLTALLNAVAQHKKSPDSSLEAKSMVGEGLLDSFKQFKNKFTNFSIVEIVRLLSKIGDIADAWSRREIKGLEAVELLAASYNHFKTKTGFNK